MSDYKNGDFLRLVFEGFYDSIDGGVVLPDRYLSNSLLIAAVSVEKIEPPVEQFKPGDRIRRVYDDPRLSSFEITLGETGYIQHLMSGQNIVSNNANHKEFHSRNYKLIYRPEWS